MDTIALKKELVDALVAYLSTRPFREVVQLMAALQQAMRESTQHLEKPKTKSKAG